MRKNISIAIILLFIVLSRGSYSAVSVKIKDITFIDGLKVNQVYGYGLVVGLQGTGDTKSPLTRASLQNVLKNLGMEGSDVPSKNTAAVLITAQLPPFLRIGDRIDVTVSSIGDAKSLEGGILIQSPLRGADNRIYAAAQGPVAVPKKTRNNKAVQTVATISNGAVIEREIETTIISTIQQQQYFYLVVKNWDYSLVNDILKAIAKKFPQAKPVIGTNGRIRITVDTKKELADYISSIENLEITPSQRAKVVINERDGTIVTGGEVKISEALVSKDGLSVVIKEGAAQKGNTAMIKDSATVKDLVEAMNAIGATTSDIMAILKALKESGSLHAELIVR